jgi:hypothetical protein
MNPIDTSAAMSSLPLFQDGKLTATGAEHSYIQSEMIVLEGTHRDSLKGPRSLRAARGILFGILICLPFWLILVALCVFFIG